MAYTRKLEKELAVAMADRKQAKKLAQELFATVEHTTLGGGADEVVYIPGVKASDVVAVVLKTPGLVARTVSKWVVAAGKVTVTMSGDPSTDHVLILIVCRN